MRPCGATRAGTQAPPLPISVIFFHASHTNKITIYAQSSQTTSTVPYVIHPNETVGANIHAQLSQAKCVGAAPVCPPERPRSGVSIPKIYALRAGNERWMRPCGVTRAGTQAPPLPISTPTTRCAITPLHCTFDSPRQSHGVPQPRSGYTFDSAWLASATQPTLGNDVRDEATPLGVVLFLITHHYHTRRMNDLPHAN